MWNTETTKNSRGDGFLEEFCWHLKTEKTYNIANSIDKYKTRMKRRKMRWGKGEGRGRKWKKRKNIARIILGIIHIFTSKSNEDIMSIKNFWPKALMNTLRKILSMFSKSNYICLYVC
jgi:hypothetical protein